MKDLMIFLKYLFVAELCLQMDTLVAKAYIFKKPCSLLREIEFLNSKTQMHIKWFYMLFWWK